MEKRKNGKKKGKNGRKKEDFFAVIGPILNKETN